MADDWLSDEIITGLQKLVLLRLPGAPPEDAVVGTVEVWIEALTYRRQWDESLDRPRIRRAFALLCGGSDSWPSPKMLVDGLGCRAPPKALPKPHYPPEKAAENLQKIRDLLKQTNKISGERYERAK